jgi:hypothetical protein
MDQSDVSAAKLGSRHPQVGDVIEPVTVQETGARTKEALEETRETRIERLGRQRPEKFKTLWAEIGFVFSVVMSQVLTVSFYFCLSKSISQSSAPVRYGECGHHF